jgi:multidrug efflux pump subunit AcrA (membrane-fusion protein)
VVPQEPAAIAAKIDGVVEKVLVRPGQTVQSGQALVRLEPEVVLQERKAAQQALGEAYAKYLSARSGAVHDPRQRVVLPELTNHLRQEQARLALADFRARNLQIVAPAAGVAVLADPDEWAGKPVTVGERIMQVADPACSRVRIYLPLTDKIDFPPQAQVKVILNNDSASSRPAILRQVAAHATERPGAGSSFNAEADWQEGEQAGGLSLGVSGTAVVYGERVPLLYWLLRRPLAALRGYCGI